MIHSINTALCKLLREYEGCVARLDIEPVIADRRGPHLLGIELALSAMSGKARVRLISP